ncbi:MAG: ATP-binding response regulator, partial [Caulobacteraceae bacterium]
FEQTALGRKAGGAGLGLSICAGNMKALGGAIGCDRAADGASRFWFAVPVERCEAPGPAHEPRTNTEVVERALRVLAAEDNVANQRVLKLLLEPLGLDLTVVEDGALALEAARLGAFDLVLMDANMPNMDGVAAVRAIRALPGPAAAVPIHMLTANVFDEDVALYRASGADGVLKKPIDVGALFRLLQNVADEASAA